MALANGFKTAKMKYGHRGANHPVKDLKTGRVYISTQNHGYMVLADSVNPEVAEIGFINANDNTVEGIRYKNKNVLRFSSIRRHVEDPGYRVLFDDFIKMMEVN